jgi:hypothetical protein
MQRRRLFLLLPVLALGLAFGGVALWGQLRESRADGLAVKYGASPSEGQATLADRCTGVMREEYSTTTNPAKAGIGPEAYALMVPKVCALGVERGLIADDGTMSEQSGFELTTAVMERMGPARVQTLVFNELAVTEYHLAEPGHVTRWDRCVAMGYSGWDAQPAQAGLPPLDVARRALREMCTVGIERGIIPESGAPMTDSPDGRELQQLMLSTLAGLTQP